jgi:hypothetical protein
MDHVHNFRIIDGLNLIYELMSVVCCKLYAAFVCNELCSLYFGS